MTMLTRVVVLLAVAGSFVFGFQSADGVLQAQAQPSPQEQQEKFLPLDQLPPQEQLSAAPLLVGAYAFVLAALFFYVVTVSRRLGTIQREVSRLDADIKRTGRT